MTTIAAVKKGKVVCIGCDSLTVFGNRKETHTQLQSSKTKLIRHSSMYIGCAGSAVWHEILTTYLKHTKLRYGFGDVDSIYLEMLRLHKSLKENYLLTPQQQGDIFESSEFLLLLINAHGIFEIDWMRNVREYSQMAVIGTGDEYALGAMKAIYQTESDPKIIVQKGLEAAAHFDKKTALPASYFSLSI